MATGKERLKLRNEVCTQEMFDKLPGLLTRFQFKFVTGLNDRDLDAMRAAKEIAVWKRSKGTYHKYYKSDAAKIGNFRI